MGWMCVCVCVCVCVWSWGCVRLAGVRGEAFWPYEQSSNSSKQVAAGTMPYIHDAVMVGTL